jgi:hypothetical protein
LKQTLYHEKPFDFKLQYVVDMLSWTETSKDWQRQDNKKYF